MPLERLINKELGVAQPKQALHKPLGHPGKGFQKFHQKVGYFQRNSIWVVNPIAFHEDQNS